MKVHFVIEKSKAAKVYGFFLGIDMGIFYTQFQKVISYYKLDDKI
jgi:hypothetical protein